MRICVIGSGYVGLVAATCLAEIGHEVVCVDSDLEKIARLNEGQPLIHEEFLQELLSRHHKGRLAFSSAVEASIRDAHTIFIAVGTPCTPSGEADLSYVESVARTIAQLGEGYKLIIEKSTVPVYTNDWIERAMVMNGRDHSGFDVVSNPEFLREGSAVTDFLYPDRIVVGLRNERAARSMREIYKPIIDGTYELQASAVPRPEGSRQKPFYIETTPQSAELIKHASNSFLALKISFINAVANICEAVGADVEHVREGLGTDRRIGPDFLRAGIGYGGSCFPKDIAAFRAAAHACGYELCLLDQARKINEEQRFRFVKKIRKALWTLKDKNLAVLGLAFKGGTDDIRQSPAIEIIQSLIAEGCKIIAYDPAAMQRTKAVLGSAIRYATNSYDAMKDADALLILTDWKEFGTLDLQKVKACLRYPIVLDGRNIYKPSEMQKVGLNYYSVGRLPLEISHSSSKRASALTQS